VIDALPFLLKPSYAPFPENLMDNRRRDLFTGDYAVIGCQISFDFLFSSEFAFISSGCDHHLAHHSHYTSYHFPKEETG